MGNTNLEVILTRDNSVLIPSYMSSFAKQSRIAGSNVNEQL